MQVQAAKIDYLEQQPGFAQTPAGKAALYMLRNRYPEAGDKAFPMLFREFKRGHESQGQQGIVLSPQWLEQHQLYDTYRESSPNDAEAFKKQLDGDRPDAYFWKVGSGQDAEGRPRMHPVQPGMVQNLARMFKWMKGQNQPLPNMDSKATTLESTEQMYKDWKAKYDRDRDNSLGTVVHSFPDNWSIRRCDTPEQCYDEGEELNHCGAKYAPLIQQSTHELYSLRDPDNWPHASFVYRPQEHTLEDIRGRSNQPTNETYTNYLKQYFSTMPEGLTISGSPDPRAPAIPQIEQYGLPVAGMEAQRIARIIARRQGASVEVSDLSMQRLAWMLTADKLNDFLRGKVYETKPCPSCAGKRFIEEGGRRSACPTCRDANGRPQGTVPVVGPDGQPVVKAYNQPEFGDPNHPEYPANKAFLDALEKKYHSPENDVLFPFLTQEYKKGRLRYHTEDREEYDPDTGGYKNVRHHDFERGKAPDEMGDLIAERVQRWRQEGYTEDDIRRYLERYDLANDWGIHEWEPLSREQVDKHGTWLQAANSQHPVRQSIRCTNCDGSGELMDGSPCPDCQGKGRIKKALDLNNTNWPELERRAEDYDDWLQAKQSHERAIWKSPDERYHVVELGGEECAREGRTMQNCVGGYRDKVNNKQTSIYSLRDKNGRPRVDFELKPTVMYNKETREEMPVDEWSVAKREATGGRGQYCDDCSGTGWHIVNGEYVRDEDGTRQHCPTCQGSGRRPPSEGNPERLAELEQFSPSPLDAKMEQIQGKQNRPPVAKYHAPLKEFFGALPQDRLPTWDLDHVGREWSEFGRAYDPAAGVLTMYHPGDYGLPDPGITTHWPQFVKSYLASASSRGPLADKHNRMRAKFLTNWAKYHGEEDRLRATLDDEDTLRPLREQATANFDPYTHDTYQQWEAQNPNPRAAAPPEPNWFDEEGNMRNGDPQFQEELNTWERANQEAWRREEAWQHEREQLADRLRQEALANNDAWKQLPGYQMYDYAHKLLNGEDLPVPEMDDEGQLHEGSVRVAPSPDWCHCGSCEPEWGFRLSNDQLFNKVRNMLRKNNQYTPESEAALEAMRHNYPEHGHLAEFMHREFRKGRLLLGGNPHLQGQIDRAHENMQHYERQINGAPGYDRDYYQNALDNERAQLEQYLEQKSKEVETAKEKPLAYMRPVVEGDRLRRRPQREEIDAPLLDEISDYVTKQGQREKGWNLMKQDFPTLAELGQEGRRQRRLRQHSGTELHSFTTPGREGWSLRYIDDPEMAKMESEGMGMCIKHYGDRIVGGRTHNYSLRDADGHPHATFEIGLPNNASAVNWDRLKREMPNYDQLPAHEATLCPECQAPLPRSGACANCGHQMNPTAERLQKVYDRWNQHPNAHNGYGTHKMSPDNHLEGGDIYGARSDEGEEGRELYKYLLDARKRGLIDPPDLTGSMVRQMSGKSGGQPTTFAPLIREWMHTIPYAQRPAGLYSNDTQVYHPRELLPSDAEGPENEYGFKTRGAITASYPDLVSNMHKEDAHNGGFGGTYDPELGQKVYDYAASKGEQGQLYKALAQWHTPWRNLRRIVCPECRNRYLEAREGGNLVCPGCGAQQQQQTATNPAYSPYQAQAVQHLAPQLAQHPELVEQAALPPCAGCGRTEYLNQEGYCNYCGHQNPPPGVVASVQGQHPDAIEHEGHWGQPCYCLYAPTRSQRAQDWEFNGSRIATDTDWGEDSDSGVYTDPDHYPNALKAPQPNFKVGPCLRAVECPTCQDPMVNGSCLRCDWGDWGNEGGDKANPQDPTRDLKSPVQS